MEPDLPSVSVAMPVRNEAAYMRRSLQAVLNQDYPTNLLEVIVADGMSIDWTRETIRGVQGGRVRIPHSHGLDHAGRYDPLSRLYQKDRRSRGAVLSTMPTAFAAMHLRYGAGSLLSIARVVATGTTGRTDAA
jgi:Glycosyl transferase family 2